MSAWMLSANHINYLVNYGLKHAVSFYDEETGRDMCIKDNRQGTVDILTLANAASVNRRYNEASAYEYRFVAIEANDAVQVLKACQSYDYQACEVADYRSTIAARIVDEIRREAIRNLPGYEEAKWTL